MWTQTKTNCTETTNQKLFTSLAICKVSSGGLWLAGYGGNDWWKSEWGEKQKVQLIVIDA